MHNDIATIASAFFVLLAVLVLVRPDSRASQFVELISSAVAQTVRAIVNA